MKGVRRALRDWLNGVPKNRRALEKFFFADAWPVLARDKYGGMSKREAMSLEEWRRKKDRTTDEDPK